MNYKCKVCNEPLDNCYRSFGLKFVDGEFYNTTVFDAHFCLCGVCLTGISEFNKKIEEEKHSWQCMDRKKKEADQDIAGLK